MREKPSIYTLKGFAKSRSQTLTRLQLPKISDNKIKKKKRKGKGALVGFGLWLPTNNIG